MRFLSAYFSSLAMSLWMAAQPSSVSVSPPSDISKLSEATLCPFIQTINEVVKQQWHKYWPLGYITSYWPTTRLHSTDHHPLGLAIEPVFNPPRCLLIQTITDQLLYEILWETELKPYWSLGRQYPQPFPHPLSMSSCLEGDQICQAGSAFDKSMLSGSDHPTVL